MANRWRDGWRQAERDPAHAHDDAETGFPEQACPEAKQAAEKALKALVISRGGEPWMHALLRLLDALGERADVPDELLGAARELDELCLPARHPSGLVEGAPLDGYTAGAASFRPIS